MSAGGIALGVNIDHVATLRQARRGALSRPGARRAGRRDGRRRQHHAAPARGPPPHPGPRRAHAARRCCKTRMNLEMAVTDEMLGIARRGAAARTAAWCRSGARRSPPRAASMSAARRRASPRRVQHLHGRGHPRGAVHRPGAARRSRPRRAAARRWSSCTPAAYAEANGARAGDRAGAAARRRAPRREPRSRGARRPRPQLPQRASRWRRIREIVELNIGHCHHRAAPCSSACRRRCAT